VAMRATPATPRCSSGAREMMTQFAPRRDRVALDLDAGAGRETVRAKARTPASYDVSREYVVR